MREIRSVNCLVVLIAVCVRGSLSFSEVLKLTKLNKSTLWECLRRLNEMNMVSSKRVLTIAGPRVIVECEEEGYTVLRELRSALEGSEFSS
ncbi:hypothetical protein IPA_07645 [Ignicoccus pacificus DSM 13166]|uniref:Winged helix DNA-binding domain-containing protein n=1 Tax=Ignicoccus pacificus DSM 13166 TaxID=940294 RepID=A0A977KBS7_9CREN|nr:hypothetical protein IPA_07645 [Ignicoccus pacificus DSM 13166]